MTSDPEHPCVRHFSWPALTGAILTGAALGWAACAITTGALQ